MLRSSRTSSVIALGALALAIAASASAQPRVRTVLAIYWSAENYPSNEVMDAAVGPILLSRPDLPVDYFPEYLESDRFPSEDATVALANYIREKYRTRPIDLVLAFSEPAQQFVLRYRQELFSNAPIVFTGLKLPAAALAADRTVTGVLTGSVFGDTLKLLLQIHPTTKRVFVVARAPTGDFLDNVRAELSPYANRVALEYLTDMSVPDLIAKVKTVPAGSVVLYLRYSQEDAGHLLFPSDVARLVAQASPVPVYAGLDTYIGTGVVGGAMRNSRAMSVRVAEMALEVLGGKRPQDISIERSQLTPLFDWRQIQRWRIEPSRLPPGSEIRFKEPTAWELYRKYIVGTLAVIAAQLVLIAGLLAERNRRRKAERTIRTREATLRESYERSRLLAGRLLSAQEATRSDIARDLHDDVCQKLVGVSMSVSSLKRSPSSDHPQIQKGLADLQQQALELVDGVRRMSHDLHPAGLRLVGLVAALEGHCVEVEKRFDVQVAFTSDGDLRDIRPDVALCVFRTAQEALRNGAMHGDARRLAVNVARFRNYIELTVADDGRGFDVEAVRRDGFGIGLVSMEERAHLLGGEVTITSHPNEGTTIYLRVPDLSERRQDEYAADVTESRLPSATVERL
jgi:signal transduction histidine kinase